MVEAHGVRVPARTRRSEVVDQLMFFADQKIDKTIDEMLAMSSDKLWRTSTGRDRVARKCCACLRSSIFTQAARRKRVSTSDAARRSAKNGGSFQRVARPSVRGAAG